MKKPVFFGALAAVIVAVALGVIYVGEPPSPRNGLGVSVPLPVEADPPEGAPSGVAPTRTGSRQAAGVEPGDTEPVGGRVAVVDPTPENPPARPASPPPAGSDSSATSMAAAHGPAEPVDAPAPIRDRTPEAPRFDIVTVNPAGDLLVAGVAVPNAEVVVFDGKIELGRARADGRGEWIVLPDASIAPGHHELSLSSRDRADENAPEILSERTVVLIVPEAGKDIAGRPARKVSGALALSVPRTGGGGSVVLQRPRPRPPAGRDGPGASAPVVDTVDYDERGWIEIRGRADEGARVQLYVDDKPVGHAEAGADGQWRVVPAGAVERGDHRLRVDQIDPKGAVVARVEFPLPGAGQFGELAQGRVAFVRPGNSLWRIARRVYGRGIRYTVIYGANRWQISDPDLIYPGQIFLLPKPPDRAG